MMWEKIKNIFKKKLDKKLESRYRSWLLGNEILLEEFYFHQFPKYEIIKGKDGEGEYRCELNSVGRYPSLSLKVSGYSKDFSQNWFKLRRYPYRYSYPLKWFRAVSFWIFSEGKGGIFKLILEDEDGGEFEIEDRKVLSQYGWQKVIYPLEKFSQKSWNRFSSKNKIEKLKIYSFLFHLSPFDGDKYLQNQVKILSLALVENSSPRLSYSTFLDNFEEENMLIPFDFRRVSIFNYFDFFNLSSGEKTIVNIDWKNKEKWERREGIRINLVFNSSDPRESFLHLRTLKLEQEIDFIYLRGLVLPLWILKNGGGEYRLILEDEDGKQGIISIFDFALQEGRYYLWIPREKIYLPQGQLGKISVLEFYFAPHWSPVPLRQEFFLFSPLFFVFSEKEKKIDVNKKLSLSSPQRLIEIAGKKVGEKEIKKEAILQEKQKKETLKKLWGLDKASILIEPTNLCNLRCIMCSHGDYSFKRPIGVMNLEKYKKIMDEIDILDENIWEISPYWLGESFIHPQLEEILLYSGAIKKKGGKFVNFSLHTNGLLLEEKHFATLLNSQLDYLLFSVDAYTQETYQKIRRGGELKKVVENILKFREYRDNRKSPYPVLVIQFIVMDQNKDEIEQFAKFWNKNGFSNIIYAASEEDNPFSQVKVTKEIFPYVSEDTVFFRKLELKALTRIQEHRKLNIENIKRKPCASLWKQLFVSWDGRVTPCQRDEQLDLEIGNVFKEGLADIWYGDKLQDLRLSHLLEDYSAFPRCHDCDYWVDNHLTDKEIETYLYSIGKEYLWEKILDKREETT